MIKNNLIFGSAILFIALVIMPIISFYAEHIFWAKYLAGCS